MGKLNKMIPDNEIPGILKNKLVFGDRDQIDALNKIDVKINAMMTRKAQLADGTMKLYGVDICIEGSHYEQVWAVSSEDAKDQVMDKTSIDDIDDLNWDVSVNEVKKKKQG